VDYSPASYLAQFIDISRDVDGVYNSYSLKDSLLTHYHVNLLNSAAYAQLEIKPVNQLKLIAALRYDRLDYTFDNYLPPGAFTGAPDAKDHFKHFTPKLGLTYDFTNGKAAYINYSVGFTPPNITDLYTGVKVPVLQASTFKNYEVGGWISFGANKGYAELSLYKLEGHREIVSVRLADGSYENQNTGKTSHNGMEANLKYAILPDVAIRLSGSYAQHKYIEFVQQGKVFSGNKMAQAPPYIYNGEITYKPAYAAGFRIGLEVQGMSSYFTDPANTAGYKGFIMFNARAGYNLRGFELWVNGVNITNRIYATTVEKSAFGTSYRPGQLRSFNMGIAYTFSKQH
jgi:outer membrane receptor protein involved in Fe transport